MKKIFKHNLYKSLFLLFLILLAGVVGYILLGFSMIEALYMTVITATTVGFGEVHPLDNPGKIFTVFLIFFSIVVYIYSFTVISEYFIEGHFFRNLNRKRMQNRIKKLSEHIILVGLGRQGSQTLRNLLNQKKAVVVVEKDEKIIENWSDQLDFYITGDATKDEILEKAGIRNAKTLITTIHDDSTKLFVVLSAKQLNPKTKIISLATDENAEKKLYLAGADHVIMPYKIGGEYIASLITIPEVVNFLRILSVENPEHENIIEKIDVGQLPGEYENKTIADLNLRRITGATIIGFITPDGKYIINPSPDTVLLPGSSIIVLGQPVQIEKLNEIFNIHKE